MRNLFVMTIIALTGGTAAADEAMTARDIAMRIFDVADSDADAVLTDEEFASGQIAKFGAAFADIDLDEDGRITRTEYLSVFDRHHPIDQDA